MNRLELIKARHAEAGGGDADKAWLIAEVERLQIALGRKNDLYHHYRERAMNSEAEANGLATERDSLQAEVERLRAAIRKHFEPRPATNGTGMSWACCDPELMAAVRDA